MDPGHLTPVFIFYCNLPPNSILSVLTSIFHCLILSVFLGSHSARDWMFVSLSNSFAEILTPKVMVLGGGGLWEVIKSGRWSSHDRISALLKETFLPPCGVTERRWL